MNIINIIVRTRGWILQCLQRTSLGVIVGVWFVVAHGFGVGVSVGFMVSSDWGVGGAFGVLFFVKLNETDLLSNGQCHQFQK